MMLGIADIERFLLPLRRRVQIMVGRAVLLAVDNTQKTQRHKIQLAGDEVIEGVVKLQEYGLETVPPADATAEDVVLSMAGTRDLAFVIKSAVRALRPQGLGAGEVQLYSKFGNKVYLKADGSIVIEAGTNAVNINGGAITLKGSGSFVIDAGTNTVNINGGAITLKGSSVDLKDSGGQPVMLETVIAKFNAHTHSGVTAGGGVTGVPIVLWVAGTDSAANVKAKA